MENENKKTVEPIPYFIHEGDMVRLEKCNSRLLIALVVAVITLLLNNVAWMVYEGMTHNCTPRVTYEQETDS